MLVYRIVQDIFSKTLYASGLKGRWNSTGKKVIYAAESIPLAFLENMVRRQGAGFGHDFKIMFIEFPDSALVAEVDISRLADKWRDPFDYSKCLPLGDAWYNEGKALVLKVPSAVMPEAYNYIINPEHSDFIHVKLIATTDLVPDERIEDILKKYPK